MEQNFNLIYQTSFENDSFLELQKYCTNLMSKEPIKIFKSLNFSSIPEKLLVSLIQSDNQSYTVSIIKVQDNNEVLGEHNLIEWTSKDFMIWYY